MSNKSPVNEIRIQRRKMRDLIKVESGASLNEYITEDAIDKYEQLCRSQDTSLGRVLAMCATIREAKALIKYGFDEIHISGILPTNLEVEEMGDVDQRISYIQQNAECTNIEPASYELVLCKSGLHHLARPILGLYEMLRVSRRAVIFIEPYDPFISRLLDLFHLRSRYEYDCEGNIGGCTNFVFRWHKRLIQQLLCSYYLDSDWKVDVTLGWTSTKCNGHRNINIRILSAVLGTILSYIPGCTGNQCSVLITPGQHRPYDPLPVEELS
jgi:hypothetical protein